jgi:hypothetical protein
VRQEKLDKSECFNYVGMAGQRQGRKEIKKTLFKQSGLLTSSVPGGNPHEVKGIRLVFLLRLNRLDDQNQAQHYEYHGIGCRSPEPAGDGHDHPQGKGSQKSTSDASQSSNYDHRKADQQDLESHVRIYRGYRRI